MKKLWICLLVLLLCMPTAQAAKRSFPKLMVTGYGLEQKLDAGEEATLKVTVTNTSAWQSAQNLSLKLEDSSARIIPSPAVNAFVEEIKPLESYIWEVRLMAVPDAAPGYYPLTLTMDYEDSRQMTGMESATVYLEITQPVRLEYAPITLPERIVEGDKVAVNLELRNLGKGMLYNASVEYDIPGLSSGSSAFAGNIAAGTSANASITLHAYKPENGFGRVKGLGVITYEDAAGKRYQEKIELSTTIDEYIEPTSPTPVVEQEKENLPAWIPSTAIAFTMGAIILTVQLVINKRNRRRQEESGL